MRPGSRATHVWVILRRFWSRTPVQHQKTCKNETITNILPNHSTRSYNNKASAPDPRACATTKTRPGSRARHVWMILDRFWSRPPVNHRETCKNQTIITVLPNHSTRTYSNRTSLRSLAARGVIANTDEEAWLTRHRHDTPGLQLRPLWEANRRSVVTRSDVHLARRGYGCIVIVVVLVVWHPDHPGCALLQSRVSMGCPYERRRFTTGGWRLVGACAVGGRPLTRIACTCVCRVCLYRPGPEADTWTRHGWGRVQHCMRADL